MDAITGAISSIWGSSPKTPDERDNDSKIPKSPETDGNNESPKPPTVRKLGPNERRANFIDEDDDETPKSSPEHGESDDSPKPPPVRMLESNERRKDFLDDEGDDSPHQSSKHDQNNSPKSSPKSGGSKDSPEPPPVKMLGPHERRQNFIDDDSDEDNKSPRQRPPEVILSAESNHNRPSPRADQPGFVPTLREGVPRVITKIERNPDFLKDESPSKWPPTHFTPPTRWTGPNNYGDSPKEDSEGNTTFHSGPLPVSHEGSDLRVVNETNAPDNIPLPVAPPEEAKLATIPHFHHKPFPPWDPEGKIKTALEADGAFQDFSNLGLAEYNATDRKTFWSTETGPVTREHFNEYKQMKEKQIWKLGMQIINASAVSCEAKASVLLYQKQKQEAEEKVRKYESDEMDKIEKFAKGLRGEVREPKILKGTKEIYPGVKDPVQEKERGKFLYDTFSDRCNELKIDVIIARLRLKISLEDWVGMNTKADEAIEIAKKLEYLPLIQRCKYYKGVAQYGLKSYWEATELLTDASNCVGKYQEGESALKWRSRAERAKNESPHSMASAQPTPVRTQPDPAQRHSFRTPRTYDSSSPATVVGGEHPPTFSGYNSSAANSESERSGDDRPPLEGNRPTRKARRFFSAKDTSAYKIGDDSDNDGSRPAKSQTERKPRRGLGPPQTPAVEKSTNVTGHPEHQPTSPLHSSSENISSSSDNPPPLGLGITPSRSVQKAGANAKTLKNNNNIINDNDNDNAAEAATDKIEDELETTADMPIEMEHTEVPQERRQSIQEDVQRTSGVVSDAAQRRRRAEREHGRRFQRLTAGQRREYLDALGAHAEWLGGEGKGKGKTD
ncbi:hypothetical protein MMC06_004969 [Schaereria dolodes]|nr:hypothetical protein [Schaereria dolodes]